MPYLLLPRAESLNVSADSREDFSRAFILKFSANNAEILLDAKRLSLRRQPLGRLQCSLLEAGNPFPAMLGLFELYLPVRKQLRPRLLLRFG